MRRFHLISLIDYFYKLASFDNLSDLEKKQLSQPVPGSNFQYVDKDKWNEFREYLLNRSTKSNPSLDPELTAYTPGETVKLLTHPKIKDWMEKMRNFTMPENFKLIVLVPCAKAKPWGSARPKKSDLYNAYHAILDMVKNKKLSINGDIYFVTISEPLGVVPQDFWDTFPQYDNPGLFKDPVMRSGGLFTRDYSKTPLGEKQIIPFDTDAYQKAIKSLSAEINNFLNKNNIPGRKFISFVDENTGNLTTHAHMLNEANVEDILRPEYRFPKPSGKTSTQKDKVTPLEHYLKYLKNI